MKSGPGGDYYTILDFEQTFGFSDNPKWSWDFDAFELLNENRGLGWIAEKGSPISVREDWFNMLNHGWKFTAVGNSDSHDVLDILAGIPRNYIASSTDDPAQLDEAELVRNIKNRHVSVNRGLFVQFGTTVGERIGEQVIAKNGVVSFNIRVQAPSWVACDSLQLIGNGKVVASFVVSESSNSVRFERTITVQPEQDTWYIAVATGSRSMSPLVHDAPVPITPLGFTNPIWVDTDGDGKFTSLFEKAGLIVKKFANDSQDLALEFNKQPALQSFALSYLAQKNVPRKAEHFAALLPMANLEERLFTYNQLSRIGNDVAKATLQKAAGNIEKPIEKFAVTIARVKSGEKDQWPAVFESIADVDDRRFLQTTLRTMSTENYMRDWQITAPFPFKENHGLDIVYPMALRCG
ncbi:MAG: CehA/McbA family metallohydrolase [bacterium]